MTTTVRDFDCSCDRFSVFAMVGALSVVGLPAVDSHTSPFLCLDLAAPTSISFLRIAAGGGGDHVAACKSSRANGRKFPRWLGSLELGSSCAVSLWHNWRFEARAISGGGSRQQQKLCKGQGGLLVTNELGGQYEDSFEDVKIVSNATLCFEK